MNADKLEWPSGVVAFLFTDIEKSTLLWERHGEQMRPVLARHDVLLRTAVEQNGGRVVKTTGDGLMAVFQSAASALSAALDAQRELNEDSWQDIAPDRLRVRMGLHSGEAQLRDGDYYGTVVNRAARIMDLGHGGQVLISAGAAAAVRGSLRPAITLRDLGTYPLRGLSGETQIYQLAAPGFAVDFPPLRSAVRLQGNLPAHVSSFVGRAREMAEVRAALPDTRLLTLTGPGGTGKTRLSLQVAADIQAEYEHGAWIVELARITDPALVSTAAAGAFGLNEQSSEQLRQVLFDYLREKELLLILDNCEHLISACARLAADLIAHCPRLTILASSREGLGVYGEATYHLPTLSLPSGSRITTNSAGQSEAVQLFVERAAAIRPGFKLTDSNAPAISQIVRRLDGIPLAIELAAARLNFFNVDQIAAHLDDRFRLLTGGSRTALPRQQTLRALIDWSYDLLDEEERALFRALSVFLGGWIFEAAESISADLDTFSLLPQLVSKSLVTREMETRTETADSDDLQPRYFFLETIRQYARDRLVESGEVEMIRDRHFAYYEELAKSVDFGAGPGLAIIQGPQIVTEYDNLRAAIEWGIERYPERVLNLIWNLSFYLADQLPGAEFINFIEQALRRLDTLPQMNSEDRQQREVARTKGLVSLSILNLFLGQLDEAGRIAKSLGQALENKDGVELPLAITLFVRAHVAFFLEDPEFNDLVAQSLHQLRELESLPTARSIKAPALALAAIAAARRDDWALVERHRQEIAALRDTEGTPFLPWIEFSLMMMMTQIGLETDVMREQFEITIKALQHIRSRRLVAMAESDWAHRLRHEGNLVEAMAIYRRVLTEWRELGHRAALANTLENMAFVDQAQGKPERALTLLGAAERIRDEVGQDMLRAEREEYEQQVAAMRAALPLQEANDVWAKGRSLSTDAVVALALETE